MTTFGKLRESWQSLGSDDPLWATLSDPRTKGGKWPVDVFLRTGQTEIDRVFTWLGEQGLKDINYGRALDFGCGAGRLTQALAKRFDRLILVAPPGFLGDLREELPKGLKDKLVDEITSDLTNMPQQRLQTHLKNILGRST